LLHRTVVAFKHLGEHRVELSTGVHRGKISTGVIVSQEAVSRARVGRKHLAVSRRLGRVRTPRKELQKVSRSHPRVAARASALEETRTWFVSTFVSRPANFLSVREKVRRDHSSKLASFPFSETKECAALIQDILNLYKACLSDMMREIEEIVRPNDE
jgi:hypothetical protein